MRGMPIDILINGIAARQHGVVSRAQLIAAGVPAASVDRRIRAGLLKPLYRGVYFVGLLPQKGGCEHAAVLACNGLVVVSHLNSAVLQGLAPLPPPSASASPVRVQVIARGTQHGRKRQLSVFRCRDLRDDEVTTWEGIPVTTPARTLLDLAGLASKARTRKRREGPAVTIADVDRAVNEAFARRLTTRTALLRLLRRHPRARGSRILREILEGRTGATRSEAERRVLALIRKAQFPVPEANATVGGMEVDFLWRERGLVVEVDGFACHSTANRFETDRVRDASLAAAGLRVVRVTWRRLTREPEATIARIAEALAVSSGMAAAPGASALPGASRLPGAVPGVGTAPGAGAVPGAGARPAASAVPGAGAVPSAS